MILLNNFKIQYQNIKNEIDEAIQRVLDSSWFILGKELESFEREFANYLGVKYCVGVASGTEAITLALMVHEIGQGDEVITTNMTAFPTITGILQSGAIPVVIDIFEKDGLIDYTEIEMKINKMTKAIVPVHLYGQSCDMTEILNIAKNKKIVSSFFIRIALLKRKVTKNRNPFNIFFPVKNIGLFERLTFTTPPYPPIHSQDDGA
ncbi:MAG: DegT/DnrJ/EryC1/StrS aminotransferase family protein, partial [Bacteroidetes bacterium]|nr:DegT/DnrJ/EryC1/StrS aminotransferase family protein [Bacteroidota bacterium]